MTTRKFVRQVLKEKYVAIKNAQGYTVNVINTRVLLLPKVFNRWWHDRNKPCIYTSFTPLNLNEYINKKHLFI